jgi:ADP-dependent phosphofructokinase/glucokinase
MSKKNYISQLKQIDNGDNSARMHEVVNQSANQIRENIKFTTTLKTDMESFYKTLRKDLGMTELSEVNEDKIAETSEDKPDKIFDPRDLNNMIDNALKKDR